MNGNPVNQATSDLYRCLCLDLDATYKPDILDIKSIAAIRLELLKSIETAYSSDTTPEQNEANWSRFVGMFNSTYSHKYGIPSNPLLVSSSLFKSLYQLVSAPLKIRTNNVSSLQKQEYYENLLTRESETSYWTFDRSNPFFRLLRHISFVGQNHLDLSWQLVQGKMRHGPGATYAKEYGSAKAELTSFSDKLLEFYPYETFFANYFMMTDLLDSCSNSRAETCRLTLVPKDWKGPRGVFISHKESMLIQLGQAQLITDVQRKNWMRVCYDPYDQDPSKILAYSSSYNRSHATLDLSDASDRIPVELVRWLFRGDLFDHLNAVRSDRIDIGKVSLPMSMFAPMGDGRTFPILSWIACCITVASVLIKQNPDYGHYLFPNRNEIERAASSCRIFGDDIICPSWAYNLVVDNLEVCNLKVNRLKSFCWSPFRESCGIDAYNGVDVTPFRIRDLVSSETSYVKLVAMHNRAKFAYGLNRTCTYLERYIVDRWGRNVVGYTRDSSREPDLLLSYDQQKLFHRCQNRWNCLLHRLERRCLRSVVSKRSNRSSNPRWGLNDFLLLPKFRPEMVGPRTAFEDLVIDTSHHTRLGWRAYSG